MHITYLVHLHYFKNFFVKTHNLFNILLKNTCRIKRYLFFRSIKSFLSLERVFPLQTQVSKLFPDKSSIRII